MPAVLDKKGNPVSVGFFDLLSPSKPRKGISQRGFVRTRGKKPPKESSPASDEAEAAESPKANEATKEDTEEPKAAEEPNLTGASKPAEEPKADEYVATAWTALEDHALLGMKVTNKTWDEICEAIPGKKLEAVKARYDELFVNKVPEGLKGKQKEEKSSDEGKKQEGKKGKVKDRGKGKGKGKGKEEDEDGDTPKEVDGYPLIVMENGEELSMEELRQLYNMNVSYDEKKWIEISSKYFDKTGKRVNPGLLKENLGRIQ